jgi:hypothetical protein
VAGEAKVSASASIEPQARVMIIKWVPEEGVEVAHEFVKDRGTMLDFPGVQVNVPAPGNAGAAHGGVVTYSTSYLLLDVVGGERITDSRGRPFKAPSETLVMGPDGQLFAHAAVLDANEIDRYRQGPAPKADDAPAEDGNVPAPAGGGGIFDGLLNK